MDHITFGDEIKHIVYPLFDGKQEDIAIFFDNFYEIVEANIKNSSILVHCAAGISRVLFTTYRVPHLSFPIS